MESRPASGVPAAVLCFVGPAVVLALAVALRASGRVESGHQVRERVESYVEIAQRVSAAEGVPLPLLLAVMSAESGGRADARSHKDAVGLMQLRAGTAADMARKGGEPDPVLTDPETSLRLGARYLALQRKRFADHPHGGDVALCAYNAGPARVSKWLRELPAERAALSPVEWVPWKEPREYVGRVRRWERHWNERLAVAAEPPSQ